MEALLAIATQLEVAILAAGAVFVRISAVAFFLPGIGEQAIPMRIKLAGALAFAAVTWPAVAPYTHELEPTWESLGYVYLAEAVAGLALGLAMRFMIFALQTAGMIAAQSLSLTQMLNPALSFEPEATIGTLLTLAAIAVAMALGLHVKVAMLLIESYQVLPFGVFPLGADLAEWSAARAGHAFNLAVSLSLPFVLIAFVYNLALGVINRAMPQMMVAFIGMPAITGLGLVLLAITATAAVQIWHQRFDEVLLSPLSL